jgi:hypothetical protein
MPDIIDILAPGLADCQSFTVNSLVNYVACVNPATNSYGKNSVGNNIFQKGDSFTVLSGGLRISESFTLWTIPLALHTLPNLGLIPWGVTSGLFYTIPNFASNNTYLPMENYECVFDSYFECALAVGLGPGLLKENFKLGVFIPDALNISMQGVPAAMNGKVFYAVPFVKILHTLPLTV